MAASLPFAPASSEYAYVRPRITHVSDFTGAEQQIFTGYPYFRGSMEFAPVSTAAELNAWRRFCSEVSEDGTFWAPLHTEGSERLGPVEVSLFSLNQARLRTGNFDALPPDFSVFDLPDSGDIAQFRSRINQGVSECVPVTHVISGNASRVFFDRETILNHYNVALPLDMYWGRPEVRALIMNEDYGEVQTEDSRTYSLGRLEWIEALGVISNDAATLVGAQ